MLRQSGDIVRVFNRSRQEVRFRGSVCNLISGPAPSPSSTGAAFFQEKLGFEIDFLHGAPPFYGSVSRGEICLHLRFVHKPNFSELAAREVSLIPATVEVSDVQGLFAEFKERGVEFAQTPN
jgi:hypothetical protein